MHAKAAAHPSEVIGDNIRKLSVGMDRKNELTMNALGTDSFQEPVPLLIGNRFYQEKSVTCLLKKDQGGVENVSVFYEFTDWKTPSC